MSFYRRLFFFAFILEIHKHNRAKRETTTLTMRMLMHAVRTSVKPRLTEGGSDVVEHGRGDQLPEGTAARLAAGERIGDLLANEAVKDDFSQTLVAVVVEELLELLELARHGAPEA